MKKLLIGLMLSLFATSATAGLVYNDWTELTQEVSDTYGCAGEDTDATFLIHEKLSLTPTGYSYHYNIDGVLVGQDTGREWIWREALNDTVAIATGETFRGTFQYRVAVIGRGRQEDFWLKYKRHLVINGGQVTSSFESLEVVCPD